MDHVNFSGPKIGKVAAGRAKIGARASGWVRVGDAKLVRID